MNHEYAMLSYAAERYVLDQMGDVEREHYEAHCFECLPCAQEMILTSNLVKDLRLLFSSEWFRVKGYFGYDT